MSILRNMFEGYKNLLFEDAEIEKMAEQRLEVCEKCDKVNYLAGSFYLHCKACICYLPAILRAPKKECKLGKWNHINLPKDVK